MMEMEEAIIFFPDAIATALNAGGPEMPTLFGHDFLLLVNVPEADESKRLAGGGSLVSLLESTERWRGYLPVATQKSPEDGPSAGLSSELSISRIAIWGLIPGKIVVGRNRRGVPVQP